MKVKRSARRRIVKNFKKHLNKYFYNYPYLEEADKEVIFDDFNHDHICFARLLGANVFEKVCPHCFQFKRNEYCSIGQEDFCDDCKYDVRVDYWRPTIGKLECGVELVGEPEIKLNCDERLIGYLQKGNYEDYSHR